MQYFEMMCSAQPVTKDRRSSEAGTGRGLSAYSMRNSRCTCAIDHLSLVQKEQVLHMGSAKGEYVPESKDHRFELVAHRAPWHLNSREVCLGGQHPPPF